MIIDTHCHVIATDKYPPTPLYAGSRTGRRNFHSTIPT
jgi:hypothetical protein